MKKKIVFLPYDFDTAIGINNEGALVFDYSLEDTDHLEGGANVFNGQDSVLWNNVRECFSDELTNMYRNLRSTGVLSYDVVESAFEKHQAVWPEAIFNEDAWYKYIAPLVEDGTGSYLEMLQGSKAEQRKWWLYNRFRYIDSKYNAGDALSDLIQVRGYAKADITVTPYADIYPTVKYGSYLVHQRGQRGVATTLVCPLDTLNDTEIYIYSASQLASVGDLSGLKVGFADFSMATKLQSVKLGDANVEYDNPNLRTLTFGNNELLKTIDVRNCSGLGLGDQKAVDASHCSILEEAYFDGTKITSLSLPNGGVVKKVHLPNTITNLTLLNQGNITEFVLDSYASITTLRLENVSTVVDVLAIVNAIPENSRVRLVGFYWTLDSVDAIRSLFDHMDTMRGLDNRGENLPQAWLEGEIHTSSLTGEEIEELSARYPFVTLSADHITTYRYYYSYDGTELLHTETIQDGVIGGLSDMPPARSATAQYTYTPIGWSYSQNSQTVDAFTPATTNQNVYGAYSQTLQQYTISFVRASADGGGTLQTINDVDYGTTITAASSYTGATPTSTKGSATDFPFEGWNPASATVTGNTVFTAKFGSPVEIAEITDDWDQIVASIDDGTYRTKYKVGNYKPLDLGTEGILNMQIVAFNTDTLADDSGKAPITFISKDLAGQTYSYPKKYGGSWLNNSLRTYLQTTMFEKIPAIVSSRIVAVKKITQTGKSAYNTSSTETVWLPSHRELFGGTAHERSGIIYNVLFASNNDRIKTLNGVATQYASRTTYESGSPVIYGVSTTGTSWNEFGQTSYIAPAFCLGLAPETPEES